MDPFTTYSYFVAAYLLFWGVVVIYLVRLHREGIRMERRLRLLEQQLTPSRSEPPETISSTRPAGE